MVLLDAFLGQMAEPIVLRRRTTDDGRLTTKRWALTGAKGRKPNLVRSFFLRDPGLEEHNIELQKVYRAIEKKEQRYATLWTDKADILFVAYGIASRVARGAAEKLRQKGIHAGLFRPISLWPYPYKALEKAAKSKKAVFVVELSYGQMVEDVQLALGKEIPIYFYGRGGGWVPSEEDIAAFVTARLRR